MQHQQIQQLQDKYNQLITLQIELGKSLEIWQQAQRLSQELTDFYQSPKWLELHENYHKALETQGNFSILSEDAIWNSLSEQRQLKFRLLKLAVEMLEDEF